MLALWNKNTARPLKWYRLPLDGCVSSTGKPYSVSLKKGTVNRLHVNFIGGGGSWSEETAANPVTYMGVLRKREFYYVSDISGIVLRFMHIGILNAKDKRNPFREWHVLNIPYSTGDFHIGNNEFAYRDGKGRAKILYHHGERNVRAALTVLRDFFPGTPEALLITGQSAGGFGCVAHAPTIAGLFPGCGNMVVHADGSYISSPLCLEIIKSVWKVRADLMEYIKSDDSIFDMFRYARDNMPPHTLFLHSGQVGDRELLKFMHKMNHGELAVTALGLNEFRAALTGTVRKLKSEIPNYFHYLTDYGTGKDGAGRHVFVDSPKYFYGKMQDGVSVADWLRGAVEGSAFDVGKKFTNTMC